MAGKRDFIFVAIALLVLTNIAMLKAQNQPAANADEQGQAVSVEPVSQWVWGEVVSTDPIKKEVRLKYVDYETDQEKDIVIAVNDKTTYENASSFDDIKEKATLSVDYMPGNDGNNVAKNISFEKPEAEDAAPEVRTDSSTAKDIGPKDVVPEDSGTQDQKEELPKVQ